MKVIGAGLCRTATTTQLIALEQLGFGPCYHMRNMLGDQERELPLWERVIAGDPDWEAILGGYESTADWPATPYYRELTEIYPDAKVLLSVRSGEGWVKSMRETVWATYYGPSLLHHICEARQLVDPMFARWIEVMKHMTWDERTGALAGDTDDDAAFAAIMERWNEQVKTHIPAERLLVWEPADGWEPLCEFLDVPVPDGPLPRVNDTAAFAEGMIGGGLAALNEWWGQRQRPTGGLHGVPVT